MKPIVPVICSLLVFGAGTLNGQTIIAGQQLEIGNPGTDQVVFGLGAAIGTQNYVSTPGAGSLALGSYNAVENEGSAAFGWGNEVGAFNSLALGTFNLMEISWVVGEEGAASNSLLVGAYHLVGIRAGSSLVSGVNNYLNGYDSSVYLEATATLGRGLVNTSWKNATLVGQYNAGSLMQPLLFAVGNGADSSNRSNAFEVYGDGKVIIPKAQGDILMGEFGNP